MTYSATYYFAIMLYRHSISLPMFKERVQCNCMQLSNWKNTTKCVKQKCIAVGAKQPRSVEPAKIQSLSLIHRTMRLNANCWYHYQTCNQDNNKHRKPGPDSGIAVARCGNGEVALGPRKPSPIITIGSWKSTLLKYKTRYFLVLEAATRRKKMLSQVTCWCLH